MSTPTTTVAEAPAFAIVKTRTRFFGAWKGALDLPYDPLGM